MDISDNRLYFYAYLLTASAVSVLISIYIYNSRTNKGFIKAVLIALRSVSLFLILILAINPFLSISTSYNGSPKNLILVDNSESMSSGLKAEEIRKIISGLNTENTVIYEFGDGLLDKTEQENILKGKSGKGYITNLSAALEDFRNSDNTKINSVYIFSDGIINDGMNLLRSAKELNAPIFFYLAGDTIQKNDVSLISVSYNRQVYTESVSEIRAGIFSFGYSSDIKTVLYEDNIPVKTEEIKIIPGTENYELRFYISSANSGSKKYKIFLEPKEGEVTAINNTEEFYINYIDNKFRTLLISGSPGPDFAFLKQTLSGTKNFIPDYFVVKSSDSYYEGNLPDFKEYDAVILAGFPSKGTSSSMTDLIYNNLSKHPVPVLFINSSNTDYEGLKTLEKYLPCAINTGPPNRIQSALSIRHNNTYAEKFRKFSGTPPLFFSANSFTAKPDAMVIASAIKDNIPAVVIKNSREYKSALFAGWNYFRWNMNPSEKGKDNFQSLISSLLSLLIENNKKEIIRINTEKTYYAVNEPVNIQIEHDYPVNETGLTVTALIISGDKKIPLSLSENTGNTQYTNFIPDSPGDYKILASVIKNGKIISESESRFIAGNPVEEFRRTKSDNSILSRLSAETGGKNISSNDAAELKNISDRTGLTGIYSTDKFLLRNSYLYLIIVIILLSLEWYIRKRNSLS